MTAQSEKQIRPRLSRAELDVLTEVLWDAIEKGMAYRGGRSAPSQERSIALRLLYVKLTLAPWAASNRGGSMTAQSKKEVRPRLSHAELVVLTEVLWAAIENGSEVSEERLQMLRRLYIKLATKA